MLLAYSLQGDDSAERMHHSQVLRLGTPGNVGRSGHKSKIQTSRHAETRG
jgi:hypothetical protein